MGWLQNHYHGVDFLRTVPAFFPQLMRRAEAH